MSNRVPRERNLHRGVLISILTALGLAAFGCSDRSSVTGPASQRTDLSNPIANLHHGDDDDDDCDTTALGPLPPQGVPITPSTTDLIPVGGGQISVGAYTVRFFPGALKEDTEISVVDVSSVRGYPCVELYPEGIHFDQAVMLTIQIPAGTDTKGYTMWWWGKGNDDVYRWIDVGGFLWNNNTRLTVNLQHFSTYAPGKAGWWKPKNPLDLPRAESEARR